MQFVDIKNDVAFRKIFGNENKKEILISFLNAVLDLPQGKKIINIEIKDPYQLPVVKGLKSTILDVKVKDERGICYIIEMQVEYPDGFDKRVLYNTAKQYSAQIERGDEYPKLNQVIFIGILNFNFFEGKDYLTKHLIINQNTGKQELKDMEFNFIELLKFNKKVNELETLVDKWIFFIKNVSNLEVIPENIDDVGLKHAYEEAEKHNWTKDEYDAYINAGIHRQDIIGAKDRAVREATEKGIEKGIEKGAKETKVQIAINMIKANENIQKIIDYTGLDTKTIEDLKHHIE